MEGRFFSDLRPSRSLERTEARANSEFVATRARLEPANGAAWIEAGDAHKALPNDRIRFAAERGCKLAMMGAAPGSQRHKNAQKNGFQIAYTRIKWQLFD